MNHKDFLQLFGGAIFVFVNRVIGAAAVFGTQILLARWMGATEVGIYVYAFSLCNLLAIIAGLGLSSSAMKFIGQGLALGEHGSIVGIARIGMQIVLFSGLCVAIAGEVFVHQTNGILSPLYIKALTLAMVAVPAMCLLNWQSTIAQCLNWFAAAFVPSNVTRPLLLISIIILAQNLGEHLDAAEVMLLHLLVMGFVWLTSALYMKQRLASRFGDVEPRYQVQTWLRTGFPLLFVALFSNFFLDINIVTVGFFLNPDQLALFNASFRIAVLIAFGMQSIDAILLPRFSRLYAAKDRVNLQRLIALTTQLKFWASVCGLVIFSVFGKDILAYFGEEFIQGYDALKLLSLAQVIRAAVGPLAQILSLTGHHAYCLFVSILSTLVMLILNYVLIGQFGLVGAAFTVVVVISVESILLSYASITRLGIDSSVFGIFYIIKAVLSPLKKPNILL
ncbi:putative Polysaccharide biosynthesis protein [Crenothrix polyspora]|uniref:Putative Polysaccharide biosynthesis protein n=1 Tax=Crenothrix polyspora TaxID=360316 RepID=A0A1R4H3Y2_9GAMM|nr:oligosaccharide flippase family protein [Crenothrix polyspora]SJM90929.1 putative Polysaccharide biosynthesis protein [Crenothrix polyspora]